MNFFEFIDWDTPHRRMPFYNDMLGMVSVRLAKDLKDHPEDIITRRQKILLMQKDDSKPCIKCNGSEIAKIYRRDRPKFFYVGYICKNCRIIYLVNRKNFRLKTYSPQGCSEPDGTLPAFRDIPFAEYMGQWPTAAGKPKKPEYEELSLRLPKKQIDQIKQFMVKTKIPLTVPESTFSEL
jgi:hypothetical protein